MTSDWYPSNYFNYFTEIEDHFRVARGSGLFLLSSLDWALIETWKNAGVPLEAVLRGIDAAFATWRKSKRRKIENINSLTFCSQAVLAEAQQIAGLSQQPKPSKSYDAPFTLDELKSYLEKNRAALSQSDYFTEIIRGIDRLIEEAEVFYSDLEQMEQRLTALEDKMIAIARSRQPEEQLFEARRALERELRPYRGKMTADQLAMLERQYLERKLLESAGLPRLSLFYLS
jgi:hypothetical protein